MPGHRSIRRVSRIAAAAAGLAIAAISPVSLLAQSADASGKAPVFTAKSGWYKDALIYEIYPRSFQDSNGDGIGDLNGITSRLDYLKALGVDAIWLTPIYPSPQVDFGYDISNYEGIDPQYGTMADFDRLVAEAKKRNIGIIMDLVLNHTSDKHPWFLASRSSKTDPKRDWYVWKDGKAGGTPPANVPNNWESVFGHSAWEWDAKTQQYYYHRFYIQQPDLNWNNPAVRKAMYDVERFWIAKGVVGFRLDAITSLFEDPTFSDEDYVKNPDGSIKINAYGDKEVKTDKTDNLPRVNDVLKELRKTADETKGRKVVLIGETYVDSIADLRRLYGENNDALDLPMDMQVGFINRLDVSEFRRNINDAETGLNGNEPLFVFDNHDNPRWDRYGDGTHNADIGRMLATILFASRDTAMMYYGDEIGMVTTPPTSKDQVKDPIGITGWPKEKGRDGERTPMQWSEGPNAGFSKDGVKTWLPIPASYKTINVKSEVSDFDSMLNWYKQLIELRRANPALRDGDHVMLNTENNDVLMWLRKAPSSDPAQPPVVVACNFTARPQTVSFDLSGQEVNGKGITSRKAKTLMKTPGASDPASLDAVQLPPYGVYIGQVE
ncbi:alpha-glucosidase [Silvibacterium dinghuense]|uniref:Alpha-glucosidase n=1 Tax=Silvibacterium dinghuense TaxID=1560006 RepID=A0A4Q1SJT1_9BACT|nr:alpha-glucosidase [Silvibacterium dinghuense]RXS97695.1 alpha-glucosidase [Silvibacterium dinghuense]GGH01236.1 oligo-1,6-glucosidase [Silvibacterium dinghuense]